MTAFMDKTLCAVRIERSRQEKLFGFQGSCANPDMSHGLKLAILMEEVGEVAHELNESDMNATLNLYTELIQVAAVAVAWAESL